MSGDNRPNTGEELREQGMADVIAADTSVTRGCGEAIKAAILELAAEGAPFSADDVRARADVEPHSPNLFGAYFGSASRAGVIEPVGLCKPSRSSRHASRNFMWQGATP